MIEQQQARDLSATAAWYDRALHVLVEGVSSPSRGRANYEQPIFMRRGAGSKLFDVDGNGYLDLMMGYGCLVHGHAHPRLVEAIARTAAEGTMFATAECAEVELAERLVAITPGVEKVRFASTGTEATLSAIRLARGLTGRDKVIKFEGQYHGWHDSLLLNSHPALPASLGDPRSPVRIPDSSGITANAQADTVIVPWGDVELVRAALDAHAVAAVITEPVMVNMGVIPPPDGFLPALREATRASGALLIMDETVTGFRLRPGGAQELYETTADIVTWGKALGAGLPVAALGGRSELMEALTWGRVLHYGTHNGSHLSVSVGVESLDMLLEDDGRRFEQMNAGGDLLAERLRTALAATGVPGVVQNVGPMLQVMFLNDEGVAHGVEAIRDFRDFCRYVDRDRFRAFAHELFQRGVYLSPSAALHSIVSSVTSTEDVELAGEAAHAALARVADGANHA
ncbi:MAG: aminotransferase class III-fold pyridoxal phosphate-dependent enzyme [Actinobacteria bacterium]|nr:aminotransferase class III-fold pyridoxal phosphate-dependent enzyme [Actinomycetota bacterium]